MLPVVYLHKSRCKFSIAVISSGGRSPESRNLQENHIVIKYETAISQIKATHFLLRNRKSVITIYFI